MNARNNLIAWQLIFKCYQAMDGFFFDKLIKAHNKQRSGKIH